MAILANVASYIFVFSTVLEIVRFLEVWLLDKEEYYAFPSYISLGRLLFYSFFIPLLHIIQKSFIVLQLYTKCALLTVRV